MRLPLYIIFTLIIVFAHSSVLAEDKCYDTPSEEASAINGASGDAPMAAFFSTPLNGDDDCTLEDVIIDLLQNVPSGESVRASFYTFSRSRMKDAFIAAHSRGVDVRIVFSAKSKNYDAAIQLESALGENRVTFCDAGCMGTKLNHNKFVLFSRLDNGDENIVLQTSTNLTSKQLRLNNDMTVIRGDSALYTAYLDYWTDLQLDEENLDYYQEHEGDLDTKVYFFPRKQGSTVVEILEAVDCVSGADVYVANKQVTRSYIIDGLVQLAQQGCNVYVIYRDISETYAAELLQGGVNFKKCSELAMCSSIHSKYMLVDGAYGDQGVHQQIVWNGTYNHTHSANRTNDETLLEVRNHAGIFNAYMENWLYLRHEHTPYAGVEAFTTGTGGTLYVYSESEQVVNPAGCVRNNRYTVDSAHEAYNALDALIRIAWKSGKSIRFQIDGHDCNGESPRIRNARIKN